MAVVDHSLAKRLRDAQMLVDYASAADAARSMRLDYPTNSAYKKGNRSFSRRAPRFAYDCPRRITAAWVSIRGLRVSKVYFVLSFLVI